MNEPGKVRVVGRMGREHYNSEGLKAADHLLRLVTQMPGGQRLAPRGVYRFKSHEEADEWMMRMLTRPDRGLPR